MTLRAARELVLRNLARSRRHVLFAEVGLVVGVATLAFFLSLSAGIRDRVINRLYPVNQVELQPETVRLFGLGLEVPARLDDAMLRALKSLPGVTGVYPKQRSRFQAKLWGGEDVFGYQAHLEAFFDGLPADLIASELRDTERAVMGPEQLAQACKRDADCGARATCRDGACRRVVYAESFRDQGDPIACDADPECPDGFSCRSGVCTIRCAADGPCPAGRVCTGGECVVPCATGADCAPGEECRGSACRRLACHLRHPRDQFSEDWGVLRGELASGAGGAACPEGTYCAVPNVLSRDGFCVAPIPVILSPFLLEVYNNVAATALGLRRLAGLEVMLGVRFAMLFGESFFVADEQVERRMVRRARVVGFSPKAMEFGVTMPLEYVVRANAALRGREGASSFTSVIVETARNEDIPGLVDDARVLGLTLSARSEEGRKAANVLAILTLVFAMLSLLILGISAINITHTFLMLVTERRMEIAVYRAVGATLWDIRGLILAEAAAVGLLGGVVGLLASYAAARTVNGLAAPFLARIPGSPDDLFLFSPETVVFGLACGVLFAILGAYFPARAAARTDPAVVLTQG